MKNLQLKILIVFITFHIGVSGSYIFLNFVSPKHFQIAESKYFGGNRSGEIRVSLVRFLNGEDSVIAEFELFNDSNRPVKYQGYNNKTSYCTLALKRGELLEQTNICFCGVGRGLHTLGSGESITYQVSKWELRDILGEQIQNVKAQVGFEILLDAEAHKQTVWSKEITFPNY